MRPSPRSALVLSITLLVLLGAAGCLPIPHTVTISPAIDGRFLDEDGRPVPNARVAVSTQSSDSTCATPASTTTTDAEGRFTFAAIRHRERWLMLMGDWFYPIRVCAGTGDVFRPGAMWLRSGSPDVETLECRQSLMSPLSSAPLECVVRRKR